MKNEKPKTTMIEKEISALLSRFGLLEADTINAIIDLANADANRFNEKQLINISGAVNLFSTATALYRSDSDRIIKPLTTIEKVDDLFEIASELKYKVDLLSAQINKPIQDRMNDILLQKRQFVKIDSSNIFKECSMNFAAGYYIFAAAPNVGKTLMMINTAKDLLLDRRKIIYITLDDSAEMVASRFMACLLASIEKGESKRIAIYNMQYVQYTPEKETARQYIFQEFTKLCDSGLLKIYDAKDCSSIEEINLKIKAEVTEDTVVFVDGMLLTKTPVHYRTEIEKNEFRANEIKGMAVKYNIPIITSNELVKDSSRNENELPKMDDIKGTGRFAFNANFIVLLWQLEKDREKSDGGGYINAFICKNKITEKKKMRKFYVEGKYSLAEQVEF